MKYLLRGTVARKQELKGPVHVAQWPFAHASLSLLASHSSAAWLVSLQDDYQWGSPAALLQSSEQNS